MKYPTNSTIKSASASQLWDWFNKLQEPSNDEEQELIDYIGYRLMQFTGSMPQRPETQGSTSSGGD